MLRSRRPPGDIHIHMYIHIHIHTHAHTQAGLIVEVEEAPWGCVRLAHPSSGDGEWQPHDYQLQNPGQREPDQLNVGYQQDVVYRPPYH